MAGYLQSPVIIMGNQIAVVYLKLIVRVDHCREREAGTLPDLVT